MRESDQQQHGSDRPGSAIIGTASGKTAGFSVCRRLAFFGLGAFRAGWAREEHIDRDQKEQDSAGNRKGRERDAEITENQTPDEPHEQE